MTATPDSKSTLPSVVADLGGKYQRSRLMLTIAFHPETHRIGEIASFGLVRGKQSWELGRNSPDFSPPGAQMTDATGQSLDDQGVSRKALHFAYRGKSLLITRNSSASRCLVMGEELLDERLLDPEQLRAGVAIFLGFRVLLLLREVVGTDFAASAPPASSALKGSSAVMGRLREQISTVAASDLDVLIRGETGTGKELVSAAIHDGSSRSSHKLVPVNMAAIPVALAPAALFGSTKGAFTGADVAAVGYFEQAAGGTLFLDEVGDTPPEIQVQLLRALQQREIQAVGGAVRKIDLRVIAATDAPLDEASDFKAALRHRLGGCEIVLQALRQHPEDIGELLFHFLQDYLQAAGLSRLLPGPESSRLEIATWAELFHECLCFSWPGNVRQLSNVAHQVVVASGEKLVLPIELRNQLSRSTVSATPEATRKRKSDDVGEEEFLNAMAAAWYEPAAAAHILKIPRTAIYRRIERSSVLRLVSGVSEQELQTALSDCEGDIDAMSLRLQVSRSSLRARLRAMAKQAK
jgi:DNA-binding NtrC family response regulator